MKLLNIYCLVQEFYAIEAISALLSSNQGSHLETMRHSHSQWFREFCDFRDTYILKFASAIYDYTILVVAAELRHCRSQASQYIQDYYSADQSRNDVYRDCSVYNKSDILKAGLRMFDTERVAWSSSFGGEKWKQIAKAGLLKGKVRDIIFVDHCVDLSHNCSIYFDKKAGIFFLQYLTQYKELLDLKQVCEPQVLLRTRQKSIKEHMEVGTVSWLTDTLDLTMNISRGFPQGRLQRRISVMNVLTLARADAGFMQIIS